MISVSPPASSALPGQSKERLSAAGRGLRNRPRDLSTSSNETATTGRLAANTARHPSRSVSSPPTAFRAAAQRDVFLANRATQHLASRVERVVVRHDQAGDDGLAQAPGGLDDALVGAVERVLREHDARAVGLDHALHDHADPRPIVKCRGCADRRGPIRCARTPAL